MLSRLAHIPRSVVGVCLLGPSLGPFSVQWSLRSRAPNLPENKLPCAWVRES